MSNPLVITVIKFENANDDSIASYGFTASDNHYQVYENQYESLEEFKETFPSHHDLILHVINLPEFEGGVDILEDGNYVLTSFSGVSVEGY